MTAACVGEHVGVVPLGAGQDGDVRPIRVEVAGVLVGLDDERGAAAPAGRRRHATRSATAGSSAPTKADGSQPGADQHVDEPAGRRALAVGPGDGDEAPPDGGVGDDLLPRLDGDAGVAGGDAAPGGRGRWPSAPS